MDFELRRLDGRPENREAPHRPRRILLAVVAALAVLIGGSVIFSSFRFAPPLSGTLLLSLSFEDPDTASGLFAYNLAESDLRQVYAGAPGTRALYGATLRPGKNRIAFVAVGEDGFAQLETLNLSTGEVGVHADGADRAQSAPSWSSGGQYLAYAALGASAEAEGNDLNPEAWQTFSTEGTGTPRFLSAGGNPRFDGGTSVVLLKSDGLYRIDPLGGVEERLLEAPGGRATILSQFDVTADGARIALSDPIEKKVFVFDVAAYGPFAVWERRTIDILGYAPTFSPDGSRLALYAPPDILVYDLADLSARSVLTLPPVSAPRLVLSDWVGPAERQTP